MSKVLVHIGGKTIDAGAFKEADHPRAADGKFGAGVGKSHAEHAAHHEKLRMHHYTKMYEYQKTKNKVDAAAHESAGKAHSEATIRHIGAQASGHKEFSKGAHQFSKNAHEASEKANGMAKTIDVGSFKESDHPRAVDGKFGAGVGKSHSEHDEHHWAKHKEHASKQGAEHAQASKLHEKASLLHGHARTATRVAGNAERKEKSAAAHAASKAAHEASEKADGVPETLATGKGKVDVTDTNKRTKPKADIHIRRDDNGRPYHVTYGGKDYFHRGEGTSHKTGERMHQLKHSGDNDDKDERIWLNHKGTRVEED